MSRLALDLSGTPCLLDFEGFHRPLGVTAGTTAFALAPWTYRRHMDTLRASTRAAGPDHAWSLALPPGDAPRGRNWISSGRMATVPRLPMASACPAGMSRSPTPAMRTRRRAALDSATVASSRLQDPMNPATNVVAGAR